MLLLLLLLWAGGGGGGGISGTDNGASKSPKIEIVEQIKM